MSITLALFTFSAMIEWKYSIHLLNHIPFSISSLTRKKEATRFCYQTEILNKVIDFQDIICHNFQHTENALSYAPLLFLAARPCC